MNKQASIVLFTDFGFADPYVGQLHLVLNQHAPGVNVIDLFHHCPVFDARAAAYLLTAYTQQVAKGSIVIAVVDPGVGGERDPIIIDTDGVTYIGPDNGLFNRVLLLANETRVWRIDWRPEGLSNTFHGRDLFAPVAAKLVKGEHIDKTPIDLMVNQEHWPPVLAQVLYIDHYGNCISGIPGGEITQDQQLKVNQSIIDYAAVFSAVDKGELFWTINSNGLVEIAANQANAARILAIEQGQSINIV